MDVEGGLVRCVGKGDKERVVPMGGAAAAAVSRYVADGRRALLRGRRRPELILNARGGPLTRQGFDYILRRVLARADMLGAASAHTFRHSFATHLLAAGADLRSVQEMLGHANVATTQLYTHVTVEHLREVFLETHPRARRRAARLREEDGRSDAACSCVCWTAAARERCRTPPRTGTRARTPCGTCWSAWTCRCPISRVSASGEIVGLPLGDAAPARRPTAAWSSAAPARTRRPATGR